jgi:GNAT superfamily N-acetyltransferase
VAVEIRQATLEDAPSLQSNCKTGATIDQVRAQLEWTTRERGPHNLEHFVAMSDDEVVGNIMLWPRGAHAVEREDASLTLCRGRNGPQLDIARLDDWVVAGRFHRRGIGAKLAVAAMNQARSWGVKRLESSSANPAAVVSLTRLGFVEWGRFPLGAGAEEVFLVVDL